ncbi:MAG TPA: 4-hydroxythreonine-4-phosphate dehydrogenase PdxA [Azospirillaceae bacterium]|mgnify:CR=1 FL=1|nr:4-hydroxythreonine-4-phosphate dehydrogenase PdxA [Azospirillaceae bacterium]
MRGSPPLAVTMGEPAGIGGELTLSAWRLRREDGPAFFVIDDPERLRELAAALGWPVPVVKIAAPQDALRVFGDALPVLPLGARILATPGKPDPANGAAVISSINQAVALTRAGKAAAVVTNPIQKSALYAAGFEHPGHTEHLAALAGLREPPVMMLAGGGLRVVLATIHLSLRQAVEQLTTESIIHVARAAAEALARDFASPKPRLAVAALNPHAGEDGTMGDEEIRLIAPAVAALRAMGVDAEGPFPADTLFHPAARARYDAVVCMHHDQGLIPLKTIAFDSGVNITLGLPFVRTSPDHGTALNLAGTGRANPASFLAALDMAAEMAAGRRQAGRE